MEYVLCQRCIVEPSKRQCYITSCSHVICEQCLTKQPGHCPVCKNASKSLKLDGNLPKNIKRMFTDTQTLVTGANKRIAHVLTFQKEQKSIQKRNELKKEAQRKEQIGKIKKKSAEYEGQLQKAIVYLEGAQKKIEMIESENEKLLELIKQSEEKIGVPSDDYDDFFMKNTPTCSSQSEGSNADNDEMLAFDLLGLQERPTSRESHCSSLDSSQAGSLF